MPVSRLSVAKSDASVLFALSKKNILKKKNNDKGVGGGGDFVYVSNTTYYFSVSVSMCLA